MGDEWDDDFDYIQKDSSVYHYSEYHSAIELMDGGLRLGIVRQVLENQVGDINLDAPQYNVEVWKGKQIVILSCTLMTRFGGVHNYEEYGIRQYYPSGVTTLPESDVAYGTFAYKSGDQVLVAALGGDWSAGVIIGGIDHKGRKAKLKAGEIAYHSSFNGLDTQIKEDGTYLVTWNGKAINDLLLSGPPIGEELPEPQYNPFTSGSYYGFDSNGSFTVSDGNGQLIKIKKSAGNISLVSGLNRIEIGSTTIVGNDDSIGVQTSQLNITCKDVVDIFSADTLHLQGLQEVSIKGLKIAIGNDIFELIAGLVEIFEAIGKIKLISPTGPCNAIGMDLEVWLPTILPILEKMKSLQGDLVDADNTLTTIPLDQDILTDSALL